MEIKMIKSDIFPPKGYKAITILPFIFHRVGLNRLDVNHEMIHVRQQAEMLILGVILALVLATAGFGIWSLLAVPIYFWWYGIEYAIRRVIYGNHREAYRNISLEQEAYSNEKDDAYLDRRRHFAWLTYLTKKSYNG
jgi:hypothetical protein